MGTKADVILRGGAVYTVDPFQPWAQAVVVCGKEIAYVGDDHGAAEFKGPQTEVIELGGKMVLPGFIDGHEHLVSTGWAKLGVDVSQARDLDQLLQLVRDHAAANAGLKVVKGFGWSWNQTGPHPTAAMLDAVVPDRPVALMNADVHDCWFNSMALSAARVDGDTPDPGGGSRWMRDERGRPDGVALEAAWSEAYGASGAFDGMDTFREGIEMLFTIARRSGVTGCLDMGVVTPTIVGSPQDDMEWAYRRCVEMNECGELPLRLSGTFLVHQLPGYDVSPREAIETLRRFSREIRSELVSIDALKLFADGEAPSYSACLLEPYADRADVDMDELGFTAEVLESYIEPAHLAGFDTFTHCDGDGGVRRVIDACERVMKKHGRRGRRHSIEHCTLTAPADIPRIAHLGLQVNATPLWGAPWPYRETFLQRYGEARVTERLMPFWKMAEAGIPVTFGADLPGVQPYEVPPLFQITAAVTQANPGRDHGALMPGAEQRRWPLAAALRAYTIMGAYKMRREHELGSLVAGKLADLVILEEDLFTLDPGELWQVPVLATMVNGRFTHRTL
jgi:predicted amidohydrolase YtcJ